MTIVTVSDICVLALFALLYAVFFGFVYEKTAGFRERKVLMAILGAGVVLRVASAVAYGMACSAKGMTDMIGDARAITSFGVYIAEAMTGKALYDFSVLKVLRGVFNGVIPPLGMGKDIQVSALVYLQGTVYGLLGYSVLFLKLLNTLFFSTTAFLCYYFLRRRSEVLSAMVAMTLVLFFPSMFVWSITGLKDPFVIMATVVMLVLFSKLVSGRIDPGRILPAVFLMVLISYLVDTTRERIVILYGVTLVLSVVILWARQARLAKKIIMASAVIVLGAALLQIPKIGNFYRNTVSWVVQYQHGQSSVHGNTFYRIYPERFYIYDGFPEVMRSQPPTPPEWARAALKGAVYFAFAPLPPDLEKGELLFLAFPQSMATLLLFPFVVMGALYALKSDLKAFLPMAVFLVLYWGTAAMVSGNIGTAFRHRDVMMPVYLIFASIGIVRIFKLERYGGGRDGK